MQTMHEELMRLRSTDMFMASAIAGLALLLIVVVLSLLPERNSDNYGCQRAADGKIDCKAVD